MATDRNKPQYGWQPSGGARFANNPDTNLPSPWGAFRPITGQGVLDASRFGANRSMSRSLGQGAGQRAQLMSGLSKHGMATNSGARERMALGQGRNTLGQMAQIQGRALANQADVRSEVEKYNMNFLKKLFAEQMKHQAAVEGARLTKERI